MIYATEYTATEVQLEYIKSLCNSTIAKQSLNKPTGDFFYDPWQVLDQYKGSPLEKFLLQIPDAGEARIIKQESGTCYYAHSDIDDRYHLNLTGDLAALIDLSFNKNYFLNSDCVVYEMDASRNHSAANFGEHTRYQLVIRKLLNRSKNCDVNVEIYPRGENPRFKFDKYVSPILNKMNKSDALNNFTTLETGVRFSTTNVWYNIIKSKLPDEFKCIIV